MLDNSVVKAETGGMTTTALPRVTGYAKGRELEPGVLVNAADLLPMHESQGNTTGENPNPMGHARWVRVGMVGNTNSPDYKSYNSNRSLTGGMYVVFDEAGHPVGRMSANTIAEVNTEDHQPKAMLQQVRMPVKIRKKVTDPVTGKPRIEERDGYEMVLVPSPFAQKEAGMPAPKMLKEGILDPTDPHYGINGDRPQPANEPFGPHVPGKRTTAEHRAEVARRKEVYAAGEEERARKRAEKEAQRKADLAAEREQQRIAAEKASAVRQEESRRNFLTSMDTTMNDLIKAGGRQEYDYAAKKQVFNTNVDALITDAIDRYNPSAVKALANAYGVKLREGRTSREPKALIPDIIAAVRAGKKPDLEADAPKVKAPVDEAVKLAAAEKRRRSAIMKHYNEIKNETDPSFYVNVLMSDKAQEQLAKAYHLEGLSGRARTQAILDEVKAGKTPDLEAGALIPNPGKA